MPNWKLNWSKPIYFQDTGERGKVLWHQERDANIGTLLPVEDQFGHVHEFLYTGEPCNHERKIANYPPAQMRPKERVAAKREARLAEREQLEQIPIFGMF